VTASGSAIIVDYGPVPDGEGRALFDAGSPPDPLASGLRSHIERVRATPGGRSDTGRMIPPRTAGVSVALDRPRTNVLALEYKIYLANAI